MQRTSLAGDNERPPHLHHVINVLKHSRAVCLPKNMATGNENMQNDVENTGAELSLFQRV